MNMKLDQNSVVAKVAFLLLLLIIFVLLLKFGIYIMGWIFSLNQDPYLIKGTASGNKMKKFPQDPNKKNAVPIMRSKNQNDGIEFTWATWLYIKNIEPQTKFKHIFHKGNPNMGYQPSTEKTGIAYPNNAPGVYLGDNTNSLVVVMNTFKNITEQVEIKDIPFNKWLCLVVRVDGRNLDVYVNGTIVRRHVLNSVPKQNYDDVYVAMNGGFNGYISNLRYYNYAINLYQIQSLVSSGPDLKMKDKEMLDEEPKYFSVRWFLSGENAQRAGYGGL